MLWSKSRLKISIEYECQDLTNEEKIKINSKFKRRIRKASTAR